MISHSRPRLVHLAILIVAIFLGNILASAGKSAPLAFPGAVGQGSAAIGGRGGDVYHVINLLDYNESKGEPKVEGSLRYGIRSTEGPRTIVFDVGGAIKLHARLAIRTNKLTIAGQTAPGGITLWGYPVEVSGASDIVVRCIRVRTGDFNAKAPRGAPASSKTSVGNGAKDLDASTANGFDVGRSDRVIIDHVSAAWGMDETLSVTLSRNVTVQNTIIAESLNHSFHPKGPHGYGTLIRGELTPEDQEAGVGGYTFYGNLWALHRARNPSIGGQQRLAPNQLEATRRRTDVNIVNNVIYGWGDQPTHRSEFGEVRINLIGNYYINGPHNKSEHIFNEAYPARTLLYQQHNMHDADGDGLHNGVPAGMADDIKRSFRNFDEHDQLLGPTHGKPFNFFDSVARNVLPAEDAYRRVLAHAGAGLSRDSIDARIVDEVAHRTGAIIDSQELFRGRDWQLPGIDDVKTVRRPAGFDSDGDGMSDEFEQGHKLNPNDPSDGNGTQLSTEGYTNLEVYLESLVSSAMDKAADVAH